MPQPLLRFEAVTKRYGPVVAVDRVDLELLPGEVHVVAGENGAGKSTLMKLLAQVERADDGVIRLAGEALPYGGPRSAQRAGIAMVHQELALAPHLSVAENLFLGREPGRFGVIARQRQRDQSAGLLRRVGLEIEPDRQVGTLSVAQQQLLEIAKALALDTRVVIMDEPTATLNDAEVDDLFAVIDGLRRQGIAVLYISHRLEEIFRVSDRVTVLRDGAVVATRPTSQLDQATLVRLMVGRSLDQLYPEPPGSVGAQLLEVRDLGRQLRGRWLLGPCDLTLRSAEIVGVAGLVGSGRTELMRAIYGAYPTTTGTIEVDGKQHRITSASEALRAGICHLSEDRKGDGLAIDMSVQANITMASLPTWYGLLRRGEERRRAERQRDRLDIRVPSVDRPVRTLSGGNQQKVALGKLLATRARIFLLDEPARGIDVGAKAEMFQLIHELAAAGNAVAMVSSYLPELLGVCSRIVVMREGRIAGELDRSQFSEERVMALATGSRAA